MTFAASFVGIAILAVGVGQYDRPLGEKKLDQATFDAEVYGSKTSAKREADGIKISLPPGEPETGWKMPQTVKIGGDFTIKATLDILKLPKPTQEDAVAVGLAIATQSIDQPDAVLMREVEPDGAVVYRSIDKSASMQNNMMQQNQPMMFVNGMMIMGGGGMMNNGQPPKPPRNTFPARGTRVELIMKREGQVVRFLVKDELADEPRDIGQTQVGPGDLQGIKLLAVNRRGVTEPVEVVFRDLTIQAAKVGGLGTAIRSVFGTVVHGDPSRIEGGKLMIGAGPNQGNPNQPPGETADAPQPPGIALPPGAIVDADGAMEAEVVNGEVVIETTVEVAVAADDLVATPVAPPTLPPKVDDPKKPDDAKKAEGDKKPDDPKKPAEPPKPPTPKSIIPMEEVEAIAFERAATLGGRVVGQPNVDVTRPGGDKAKEQDAKDKEKDPDKAKKEEDKKKEDEKKVEDKDNLGSEKKPDNKTDDLKAPLPGTIVVEAPPKVEAKPNGIRDLHISLSNLRPAAIRQVQVSCQGKKGQTQWQLDTTGSPAWPLVVQRSGTEPFADLFLEPPEDDCHDQNFTINVSYADNQNGNANLKSTEHSDAKIKFDPDAPAPALNARVYLGDDEQLFGVLESIGTESLTLVTPWNDKVEIPIPRISGIYMGLAEHKETPTAFAKRLKERGSEDILLARSKDGDVVAIPGVLEAMKANRLTFEFQGKVRGLPLKSVEGIVMAARPEPKDPDKLIATFNLSGGQVVSGTWKEIDPKAWKVETPWGSTINLPATDVQTVRFKGGQMTYMSDLDPSRVEETPFFGRVVSYRRDKTLLGEPIKMADRMVDHGIAVHSRSSLTFDLNRRYERFEATVGFDDGNKKGRVDCRVFADGKEVYANPDLRADAPPVALSLAVAGAEQVRIVVDFGADQDTADRVIWANPRLFRKPPPAEPPTYENEAWKVEQKQAAEKAKADAEKAKADAEKAKADAAKPKTEAEKKAEADKKPDDKKAEAEKKPEEKKADKSEEKKAGEKKPEAERKPDEKKIEGSIKVEVKPS